MDNCAVCGAPTVIARSKNRTVVTYAEGMFEAVEVQKKCSVDSFHSVMKSEALARIVRPRQRFGYDLIVYVGLMRYLKKKQREEICEELFRKRAIKLSAGTVSNLCDRFLLYLEALHLVRSPYQPFQCGKSLASLSQNFCYRDMRVLRIRFSFSHWFFWTSWAL